MNLRSRIAAVMGSAFLSASSPAAERPVIQRQERVNHTADTMLTFPALVTVADLNEYLPQMQRAIEDTRMGSLEGTALPGQNDVEDSKAAIVKIENQIFLAAYYAANPAIAKAIDSGQVDPHKTGDKKMDAFLRGAQSVTLKDFSFSAAMNHLYGHKAAQTGFQMTATGSIEARLPAPFWELKRGQALLDGKSNLRGLKVSVRRIANMQELDVSSEAKPPETVAAGPGF